MENTSLRQRETGPEPMSAEEKLQLASQAVLDLKAVRPVVLDMRAVTLITDYFVICHGTSNIHIRALADRVLERFEQRRLRPFGMEGYGQAQWILLDYGDVVVHVFAAEPREFYGLERLWNDAPRTELAPETDTDE